MPGRTFRGLIPPSVSLPASVLRPASMPASCPASTASTSTCSEAGREAPGRPAVLLLHGFPEPAYSWREVLPALAAAGSSRHRSPISAAIAASTGGAPTMTAVSPASASPICCVTRSACSPPRPSPRRGGRRPRFRRHAAALARCASDIFKSVVLISGPFVGPPSVPSSPPTKPHRLLHAALRRARPTAQALPVVLLDTARHGDMWHAKQGVPLPARLLLPKSADWKADRPFEALRGWTANEVAKMPTYYVMDLADGMAETVAGGMPSAARSPATLVPIASSRSTATSMHATASGRAATGIVCGPAAGGLRDRGVLGPHRSMCPPPSSPVPATGVSIRRPARLETMRKDAAPG